MVRDLGVAVAYYRDAVGLEQQVDLDTPGGRVALLRGHGATVLLQESADTTPQPAQLSTTGLHTRPWAAALLVDDIDTLHTRLHALDATRTGELVPAFGTRFFEFVDCSGNLVGVGEAAAVGLVAPRCDGPGGVFGLLDRVVGDRLRHGRSVWRGVVTDRRARRRVQEFRAFYVGLTTKRDTFYMFFTSGLLHWAAAAEAHVPRDTNLVLLGSDLADDERAWIAEHIDRPVHHIGERIDDIAAWQLLFEVNEHNFGWLDIDCFVLDAAVFAELADIDPQVSMNCAWSMATDHGFPIAGTHLLFVNHAAITAVRAAGVPADPGTHDWVGRARPLPQLGHNRIPGRRARALLREVAPDHGGNPAYVSGAFYDTLMLYQLLARAVGYPIRPIRSLARRCTLPVDAESLDRMHWPEDVSDELFHLCGISYYSRFSENPGILALYLAAEMTILDNALTAELPGRYSARANSIRDELAGMGMSPDQARQRFRRHLIDSRGLGATAADAVLASGRRPQRHLDHADAMPAADRLAQEEDSHAGRSALRSPGSAVVRSTRP